MSTSENKQEEFSTELLRVYYGRLFPYDQMFNWLSYGNDPHAGIAVADDEYFMKREWSFTIEDDVYIRYQSFRDKKEMTDAIQKRQPHKIDIGAIFTAPPKDHTTIKPELFKTVERELVFDIDMTDYDSIRTCCSGANICRKCWPFMTMALRIVDTSLREDFAFKHILWIYSGRRGIHCWVCDQEARNLPNEARAAIVDYLTVEVGSSENSDRKLKSSFKQPLHPMIQRSYSILEKYFEDCVVADDMQGIFATKERYTKVISTLPDKDLRDSLFEHWEKHSRQTSVQRWNQLNDALSPPDSKKGKKHNHMELQLWRTELIFTYCYPRLDANVSKAQNHLLKSPFCVHPKTGRVCVPIDPVDPDSFDPFAVPTVRTLCEEMDAYKGDDSGNIPDVEKTSLNTALRLFDKSFMQGLREAIRKGFRDREEQVAAMNVDF